MRGTHHIIVQNKRIRYDFELRRNLTVLRGDSATGKTTLIDMIQEYTDSGEDSSIELRSDKPCYVLGGATWKGQLSEMRDCIVFIDEGNPFVFTDEFSAAIQATDNYYVIVSREGLQNLPYSVEEIYGIRMSGRYGGLKQCYNEFYRIYGTGRGESDLSPKAVITEDSNAGFQFFESVCRDAKVDCRSAGGKSNLLQKARQFGDAVPVLLIGDGAAFGSEMDRVMKYMQGHENVRLYVPESFEWLILSGNVIKNPDVKSILESPSAFIESEKYFSWERFFTALLTEKAQGTYLQYTQNRINPSYLKGSIREAILHAMISIRLGE